jgi:hypothetical protein
MATLTDDDFARLTRRANVGELTAVLVDRLEVRPLVCHTLTTSQVVARKGSARAVYIHDGRCWHGK